MWLFCRLFKQVGFGNGLKLLNVIFHVIFIFHCVEFKLFD